MLFSNDYNNIILSSLPSFGKKKRGFTRKKQKTFWIPYVICKKKIFTGNFYSFEKNNRCLPWSSMLKWDA